MNTNLDEKMKFTPGPWNDNKVIICRGLTFVAHAHFETEEGVANTRLISAAPDLLEAVNILLPWAESASCGGPDIAADLDKARAAITKALGES